MGNLNDEIDWARVHRPQLDGYDTDMIAKLAAERYKFVKDIPAPGEPSMFKGQVALVHITKPAQHLVPAPFDHPCIKETEETLYKIWPEQALQVEKLLQSIAIMVDSQYPIDHIMGGCTCGNTANFGGMCVTVQGVMGFAHGIVHELAHWKMHAMGVHLEDWDNLVANSPSELFESPIRKDKPRPVGACLQAQYSYLHVLELEIRAHKAGLKPDMLALNVQRMTAGRETLKVWRPDKHGEAFAKALDEWTGELLAEGGAIAAKL